MSLKKTGLAKIMRKWMKGQKGAFTLAQVCEALGTPLGEARFPVYAAMHDFAKRGEVVGLRQPLPPIEEGMEQKMRQAPAFKGSRGNTFRYNPAWRPAQRGKIKPRILKAMYLCITFAATDIARLAEAERNHVDKEMKKLRANGWLQVVGRRLCAHGRGAEKIYHIVDRDRFRIEKL